MTPKLLYRIASVLLVLYASAHQLGVRRADPKWNAEATVAAMKTTFIVSGNPRSYWDFFSGFGFFCTGLLLFAAVLAWQLSGLPADVLSKLSLVRWAFGLVFAVMTILTWRYFFPAPTIFSALVTINLVVAALQNG